MLTDRSKTGKLEKVGEVRKDRTRAICSLSSIAYVKKLIYWNMITNVKNYISSRPEVFFKNAFLKLSQNSQGWG